MSPVEVCACDVKAVNVTRNDRAEEQYAIEYAVPSTACYHHHCQRRKEDVDAHYYYAVREASNHDCHFALVSVSLLSYLDVVDNKFAYRTGFCAAMESNL